MRLVRRAIAHFSPIWLAVNVVATSCSGRGTTNAVLSVSSIAKVRASTGVVQADGPTSLTARTRKLVHRVG